MRVEGSAGCATSEKKDTLKKQTSKSKRIKKTNEKAKVPGVESFPARIDTHED